MNRLVIYYVTAPNHQVAIKIAHQLVQDKLVACCNIIPNVTSIYRWKQQIQTDNEVLMMLKSRQQLKQKIIQSVKKNHPYEVPQIIGVPIMLGSKQYMDWIESSTMVI